MAAEPLNVPDLADRLSDAKTDYKASWKQVDRELYELCCSRRPRHDHFDDVYPKVAIIGRVYAAGVSRAWRGKRDCDPEAETARALIEPEQAGPADDFGSRRVLVGRCAL
jgi:hypothetical protein